MTTNVNKCGATGNTPSTEFLSLTELLERVKYRPSAISPTIQQETFPPNTTTCDEKLARRRMQYKLHQRRHRAKQKQLTDTLENEVSALNTDIAALTKELNLRQARTKQNLSPARGLMTGGPMKVAMEFFRLFKHGYSQTNYDAQQRFVRSTMIHDLQGPDYMGVDTLLDQWILYKHFFAYININVHSYELAIVDEMTIITVTVQTQMCPRRDGITMLLPNLIGHEELVQEVVNTPFYFDGTWRFMFDPSGEVSFLGVNYDFLCGIQMALGSLEKASVLAKNARMSFSTGQIRSSPTNSEKKIDVLN